MNRLEREQMKARRRLDFICAGPWDEEAWPPIPPAVAKKILKDNPEAIAKGRTRTRRERARGYPSMRVVR